MVLGTHSLIMLFSYYEMFKVQNNQNQERSGSKGEAKDIKGTFKLIRREI